MRQLKIKVNNETILFILFAFVLMSFCTTSSFLYPINDWIDANTYMLMGRGILDGKIMYRDMIDHKGPYLYFLHVIACIINRDSFIGVFIIQVIACIFSMYFINKIMKLITSLNSVVMTCIYTALIYSSPYLNRGDSAEELALPILLYMLYVGVKAITLDKEVSRKELLLIGITSGVIFWTKFTLCVPYLAFALYFIIRYIKQKKYKQIFEAAKKILFGVLIVTIPILLYFLFTGTLKDLFYMYFEYNIFEYGKQLVKGAATDSLKIGKIDLYFLSFIANISSNKWLLLIFLGTLGKNFKSKVFYIVMMISSTYMFMLKTYFPYYVLPLCIYIIFSVTFLERLIKHIKLCTIKTYMYKILCSAIILITFILAFNNTKNTEIILKDKESLPQYQIAKIISNETDQTLICYNFGDFGVSTFLGVGPCVKYTILPNFASTEEQHKYIKNKEVNFIIINNNDNIQFNGYEEVYRGQFDSFDYYNKNLILLQREN